MKLTSSAFQHEGYIPRKYTCDGHNINPPFSISHVPSGAQSLVLILEDPDVPTYIRPDGMWNHWIVFNIPPHTTRIIEGREPAGMHGLGTGNNTRYYGPCPQEGEHRYFFKLYALDIVIQLPAKSIKEHLLDVMQDHILAQTELMGIYGRS